jgi:hypothetical protein
VVPDAVLARRDKVGFEPPQAAWLREPGFRALIGKSCWIRRPPRAAYTTARRSRLTWRRVPGESRRASGTL